MRLSFTILVCHSAILLLLAMSIGMEVPAWLNDYFWNDMKDHKENRFNLTKLQKCKTTFRNGSVAVPTQEDYDRIFQAKKRDLPFETYFLGVSGASFLLYFITSLIYIFSKRIMPNIYLMTFVNLLGAFLHAAAFSLILAASVVYSEEHRNYMGAKICYYFKCTDCPPDDFSFLEREKEAHDVTRTCLENLHVCHSNWLKDRIVYLLLGCILSSCIAFTSSVGRYRRRVRKNQIQPKNSKKPSIDSDDSVVIHPPSLEDSKRKSLLVPEGTVINSVKTSSEG